LDGLQEIAEISALWSDAEGTKKGGERVSARPLVNLRLPA